MNTDRYEFLKLARLPGRLTSQETAYILGFAQHDISVLVAHRLLKALGNPPPNGGRYFSSVEVENCRCDTKWLDKASGLMVKHWKTKNTPKLASGD
jgi:hypothetical protein